jgi:hypothetical protein
VTLNYVTVTAQWGDGTTNIAEGNYEFVPSGSTMDSSSESIATATIQGTLDTTGSLWNGVTPGSGVQLLASDNFGLDPDSDPELTWNIKIIVQGVPEIVAADIPVNYANGATQGLFAILEAAGWVPPTT